MRVLRRRRRVRAAWAECRTCPGSRAGPLPPTARPAGRRPPGRAGCLRSRESRRSASGRPPVRQAAEAVRCRIDFKYAMAMELDDPGFHHSVLADFRDRLAEDDRADRLLDLALARLKEAGLVRERTTQRTDSTHVLAAVRGLTRLELITEAVRAALEEVAGTSPHLLDELVDEDWGLRYGRPVRLGKNPTKPKTRILATGNDAVRLLEHLYRHGTDHAAGPRVQALRQIVVQNYHRDAAGHLRWRTAEKEDGPGLPPDEETPAPRRPTAFQDYLDQREIPRLKSWRTLGS
ncbi:transposase [Streptomyces sp. NPDC002476]|uniref:transposase n=1 Tax=Streptomyces sp. NPDC002476 TaxID=3364648 RepID=UPI003685E206